MKIHNKTHVVPYNVMGLTKKQLKPIENTLVNDMTIHKALKVFLLLPQLFGYMPLQGIFQLDVHHLKLNWKSYRTVYAIFTLCGALFLSTIKLYHMWTNGVDIYEVDKLFFFLNGVVASVIFFNLARHWQNLIKNWLAIEKTMINYGWTAGLNRKLNRILIVFLGMALAEHILMESNKLYLAFYCKNNTKEAFEYFLGNMSYSSVFSLIGYNIFLALILQMINFQLVFCWTFVHVFIIVISLALSLRLRQVTLRIKSTAKAQIENENAWRTLREDYNRLGNFCGVVNHYLSNLVLVSFANNLFFIIMQLFNSLKPMRNNLERVYFYFSFGLLIARTVYVCLYGSMVHEESRNPLPILSSVTPTVYNREIERFIMQIGSQDIAISGKRFFIITRGLILTFAGAIVTYELVLIQFNPQYLQITPDQNYTCVNFA